MSLPTPLIPLGRTFDGFSPSNGSSSHLPPPTSGCRFARNLRQPWGLLHGGIYCAVAESVASIATWHEVWHDGLIGLGLNSCASFLQLVTTTVDVAARLRNRDNREWLWSHEFRDEQSRLCALVDVTIAVRPFAPRSANPHA